MRCKTVAGEEWVYLTQEDLLRLLGAFDSPAGARILHVPGSPYIVAADLKTGNALMLKSEQDGGEATR